MKEQTIKVVISGFGNVGRALARLIVVKHHIAKTIGVKLVVTGVIDSKGAAIKEQGFTAKELLNLTELPRSYVSLCPYGRPGMTLRDVLDLVNADAVVEATPPNYLDGEPGISNFMAALEHGCHIVTANKAPLALQFRNIMRHATSRGLKVLYKATVMAGTPLIDVIKQLRVYEVKEIEGILNGTTNYVLTLMEEDLVSLDFALKKAQTLGIAEPEPFLDINGWDIAAKLVIIGNTLGLDITLEGIKRHPLKLSLKELRRIHKLGMTPKYVGSLDTERKEAEVKLKFYPKHSLMALTHGTLNSVLIRTLVNDIYIQGKGAGSNETAYSLLSDIISLGGVQH